MDALLVAASTIDGISSAGLVRLDCSKLAIHPVLNQGAVREENN